MQCAIENTKDMLARGLEGGGDGDASRIVVWPDTDKEFVMQERTSFFGPLAPGDVVSVRSGGGRRLGLDRSSATPDRWRATSATSF